MKFNRMVLKAIDDASSDNYANTSMLFVGFAILVAGIVNIFEIFSVSGLSDIIPNELASKYASVVNIIAWGAMFLLAFENCTIRDGLSPSACWTGTILLITIISIGSPSPDFNKVSYGFGMIITVPFGIIMTTLSVLGFVHRILIRRRLI